MSCAPIARQTAPERRRIFSEMLRVVDGSGASREDQGVFCINKKKKYIFLCIYIFLILSISIHHIFSIVPHRKNGAKVAPFSPRRDEGIYYSIFCESSSKTVKLSSSKSEKLASSKAVKLASAKSSSSVVRSS